MKQLSSIFNVVDEAVGVTICEYLGIGDGPGKRAIYRFAIDWDADRDERIVTVIEEWISNGMMDHVLIVGERKACLSVITEDFGKEDYGETFYFGNWLSSLLEDDALASFPMPDEIVVPCIGGEDVWYIEHVRMNKDFYPDHKQKEIKERYRSLISLFCLGFRGVFVPARRA